MGIIFFLNQWNACEINHLYFHDFQPNPTCTHIKRKRAFLKNAIHGQKHLIKERHAWDKTCVDFGLRPKKLSTLVKTGYMCWFCFLLIAFIVFSYSMHHGINFMFIWGFFIKNLHCRFLSQVILFQDALTLWAPIIVLCYSQYFRWHCKGTFHLWKLGQFVKQWWKCCHRLWHMCWIKVMIISSLDMFCSLLYPHVVALWWSFPPNYSWKGMHLNKKLVLLLKRLKVEIFKLKYMLTSFYAFIFWVGLRCYALKALNSH
jgi:hypothetical protein